MVASCHFEMKSNHYIKDGDILVALYKQQR